VVKVGVAVAVAVARARAVGGDEDNGSDCNCRGPYNNQLIGPVEETVAAAMVMATETAIVTYTATVIATIMMLMPTMAH
jgi:hypothetical protein